MRRMNVLRNAALPGIDVAPSEWWQGGTCGRFGESSPLFAEPLEAGLSVIGRARQGETAGEPFIRLVARGAGAGNGIVRRRGSGWDSVGSAESTLQLPCVSTASGRASSG